MARDGLSLLLCAGLSLGALVAPARAGDDNDNRFANTLAVQSALRQGREQLVNGNYQAAVTALESQIARIEGDPAYLTALRDAYRGYIKELRLAKRDSEATLYSRRLEIIDPGSVLDLGSPPTRTASLPPAPVPAGSVVPASATIPPPADGLTARAKSLDTPRSPKPSRPPNDPFDTSNHARSEEGRGLLAKAEEAFRAERYTEAAELYAKAHDAVPDVTAEAKERWAYCKLHQVAEKLNRSDKPTDGDLQGLEREVRLAMGMTPKLQALGKNVLASIDSRRAPAAEEPLAVRAEEPPPAVAVKHGRVKGWAVADTVNFRIFHNAEAGFAEKVARAAEATRSRMQQKWFGKVSEDWNPRCDVYLYPTADDYARATGVPPSSPGHSTIQSEGQRVMARRIDLHVDDPNMLEAVLPHEATHVVLAGRFGPSPVPRWADEGMAVLTEPREKIDRHLRNLPQHLQDRQLFQVRDLMRMDDYPEPRQIGAFYAQSVSLVEFLSRQRGPQVFTQFLTDGLRQGYEPALKKHYGFQSFQEMENQWRAYAFQAQPGVVQK